MIFNNFWGFQKNEYFEVYEDFVDIFFFWGGGGGGVHHKVGLYSGVISMHIRVFSNWQGTEWGINFWAVKISNIFWGA